MAGQDIKKLLAPGQSQPVQVGGDFIFMKTADRPIVVIINGGESSGSRVTMTAGDKYRPGSFQSFEIENTDKENAAEIVLTVGRGDYNRQTVTGQITTRLGILNGRGEYIDDTRSKLTLDAITIPGTGITENFGEKVAETISDFNYDLGDGFTFLPSKNMSYNGATNEGIILNGLRSPGNSHHAIEIDPVTGQFIRQMVIADLGEPGGVTRWGGIWYQKNTSGTRGIYRRGLDGQWALIHGDNSGNNGITTLKDGSVIFCSYNGIKKINANGQLVASADCGWFTQAVSQDDSGRVWVFSSANYNPKLFDIDLNPLGQAEGTFQGRDGIGIYGAYAMRFRNNNSQPLGFYAMQTVEKQLAGKAYLSCANAWLGKRPAAFTAMRSKAAVTVANGETGSPTVSGELIKLVMEWYLGRPVPVNYMDFLHGIQITGNTDMEGISYPPVQIESNGQTLLAAKIPDNFTQVFPIRVQATIDTRINEL